MRFVGAAPGPVVADSGVLFLGATHSYAETPSPDVVLVPGSGPRTATMMADKQLTDWLRQVHETTRSTTSVCTGAMILAATGLLDGLPATTHWLVQPGLAAVGAKAQRGQRIVRAGRLATAAGVSAGIDLGLWPARWPVGSGPRRSSCTSSTTRSRRSTPVTRARRARPWSPRPGRWAAGSRLNPSEVRAVPTIVWQRVLNEFRRWREST